MDVNAKIALNNLKMEIAHEMGFNYNSLTNKVESNAPQNTLMGQDENVLDGDQVDGQISKRKSFKILNRGFICTSRYDRYKCIIK